MSQFGWSEMHVPKRVSDEAGDTSMAQAKENQADRTKGFWVYAEGGREQTPHS